MKNKIKLDVHANIAIMAIIGAWLIVLIMVNDINDLSGSIPTKFVVSSVDGSGVLLNKYIVKDASDTEYKLGSRYKYQVGDEVVAWKNVRPNISENDRHIVYDVTKMSISYVMGVIMLIVQVVGIGISLWDCNWRKKNNVTSVKK